MEQVKIDWTEAEELAAAVLEMSTDDVISEDIEIALAEKFNIDIDGFHQIAQKLFDMIAVGISPLTNKALIGYSIAEKNYSRWILKKEINSEFISLVIQWICEDNPDKITEKGCSQSITKGGEPEYEVIIRKTKLKEEKKPEGYISDELTITFVEFQGNQVEVKIKYLNAYLATVFYPIGNKSYSSFNTEKLPAGIHSAFEELVNNDYENEIFEYIQEKGKEPIHD